MKPVFARSVKGGLINALLLCGAALILFPLVWMLSVSFMAPGEASSFPPPFLPAHPTFANYRELFDHHDIGLYLLNSMLLATAATLISLTFNVAAGYAFAKLRFSGRDRIFKLILGVLVIPGQVTMLPLFLMLKSVGLVNTYVGVLVPSMVSIFGIFLVRQYALGVPDVLLDAARIDGAGEFRIFRSIVLPLLAPILVTLAIFSFLASWNDFMWPLIVLAGNEHYTLPVALASFAREHGHDNEMMMAGSVLTVVPVLLIFIGLQRYYMRGMLIGSVKG
ncbi:carbohydrate ABC transporter permease [Massilia sp. TW-1]|uniref:Carbohydrate ABC transporter permease n=1 Tax=Telluria antibiotica TaxID=2717319 RepID=A0ABX0PG57_9BURK|nr:carbohydrate ABC transporter permease [Telluria antibiotica]NIA56423.1 carbohydrate ABC transporter permease [Telluria antibiotica]